MAQYYRLYFIDGNKHIRGAYDFLAPDDGAARREAEKHTGEGVEIWQGARMVSRAPSESESA